MKVIIYCYGQTLEYVIRILGECVLKPKQHTELQLILNYSQFRKSALFMVSLNFQLLVSVKHNVRVIKSIRMR